MRAGLIISGAFLIFFGAILFFTIILTLLGMFFGFIGFIMLLVGLVTSSRERVLVSTSPTVTISPPPNQPQEQKVLAICPECKNRIPANARFCSECGADLRPKQSAYVPPPCPRCKGPLTFVSKYQRWYCYKCQKYV